MPAIRASIERVPLRRDLDQSKDDRRRAGRAGAGWRYRSLRRAGRASSRRGLSSGAGGARQRRRRRRHRAGSAGAGLQAHRSISGRCERQDVDDLDRVAIVAEPATATLVEGEQDGCHRTPSCLRCAPSLRRTKSACSLQNSSGTCSSRFAGCRRNCAMRCCWRQRVI